jgi:hypothetical protein
MQMILKYLSQYEEFEIAIFEEDTIKNKPVEVRKVILNKLDCVELAIMQRVDRLLFKRVPIRESYRVCLKVQGSLDKRPRVISIIIIFDIFDRKHYGTAGRYMRSSRNTMCQLQSIILSTGKIPQKLTKIF